MLITQFQPSSLLEFWAEEWWDLAGPDLNKTPRHRSRGGRLPAKSGPRDAEGGWTPGCFWPFCLILFSNFFKRRIDKACSMVKKSEIIKRNSAREHCYTLHYYYTPHYYTPHYYTLHFLFKMRQLAGGWHKWVLLTLFVHKLPAASLHSFAVMDY